MNGNTKQVADELSRFEAYFADLIKAKQLHRASSEENFEDSIRSLSKYVLSCSGFDRLRAISVLCKLGSLVRSTRSLVRGELVPLLEERPIPLSSLRDPDSRYYAAMFWRFGKPEWAARYLADSIVEEESAENARQELTIGLVTTTATLAGTVDELILSLRGLKFGTDQPEVSLARRLRRCVEAMREAISNVEVCEPGERFGESLRNLARTVSVGSRSRIEAKAFSETADSMVKFLNAVVRMRLRAAFEPNTFKFFFTLRDWFDKPSWVGFVERGVVQTACRDILDCIEVMARSGRSDGELLRLLDLLSDDPIRVTDALREIVDRNPGLSPATVSWLTGAPIIEQSADSEANEILRLEAVIARLMICSERDDVPDRDPPQRIPSELRLLVQELANERRLQTFGRPGTVVTYSALEHELAASELAGIRAGKIVRAGVVGRTTDGRRRIVLKAVIDRV